MALVNVKADVLLTRNVEAKKNALQLAMAMANVKADVLLTATALDS